MRLLSWLACGPVEWAGVLGSPIDSLSLANEPGQLELRERGGNHPRAEARRARDIVDAYRPIADVDEHLLGGWTDGWCRRRRRLDPERFERVVRRRQGRGTES